jgi:hypothetical protein
VQAGEYSAMGFVLFDVSLSRLRWSSGAH